MPIYLLRGKYIRELGIPDLNGSLISETDALGNTVSYGYTPEGWLETITDAEGRVTRFTYDRTGNLITEDCAGELHRENTYNELGMLITVTTEEGVTEYQYDGAGRLISVKGVDGSTTEMLDYENIINSNYR